MMYAKALLLSLGLWGGSTCDLSQPSNATCQLNEKFSDPCSDHFIHPLMNATIVATIIGVGLSLKSDREYSRKIEELSKQDLAAELAQNAADIEVYRIAQEAKAQETKDQEAKVQEAKDQEAKAQETKAQEAKAQEAEVQEAEVQAVIEREVSPVDSQRKRFTKEQLLYLINNMHKIFDKGPEAFNQDHLRSSAR